MSVSLCLSYFISFHLLGNIDIVKTNYKKSSDLNLFLKVEYFLIELCIAVAHSPCGACIYSPLFSVSLPPSSAHTHTLWTCIAAVYKHPLKPGYITINLSEFLLYAQ